MSEQTQLFSLGLTYWPRRSAFRWWQAFDRGETHEELAHVAALGCDTVRFQLLWEDFQPGVQRINSAALQALEHALDSAQAAGLRVVAGLFPVALGGALQLPSWANGADPLEELFRATRVLGPAVITPAEHGPALLYEGAYRVNKSADLFSDTKALNAQRYLIRELVGYFGSHPALYAWQLGEGFERVHQPESAAAVQAWYATMVEELRAQRASARVLGVVSARALTLRSGPRPEHVADTGALLGVSADPPQRAADDRPDHSGYVAYLHALTASLASQPALVASLALPTAPDNRAGWISDHAYGRPLRAYRGDTDQQALFIARVLDRLQRAGATGAWLAAYGDFPAALWREPPLDRAIRARTLGLVDAEGRDKPAALVFRSFAAERRPVAQVAPPLDADPERYWRDPKQEFADGWRAWSEEERG